MQKLPYFVRCNVLDLEQLYEDLDNEGFELKNFGLILNIPNIG